MSDDAPLYVPEEFVVEHLGDVRRSVAEPQRVRRPRKRLLAAALPDSGASSEHRSLAFAIIGHGLAALFAVLFTGILGTWLVGLAVLGLIGLSLGITARVIYLVHRKREFDAGEAAARQRNRW